MKKGMCFIISLLIVLSSGCGNAQPPDNSAKTSDSIINSQTEIRNGADDHSISVHSPEETALFQKNMNVSSVNDPVDTKNTAYYGRACYIPYTDTLFYSDPAGLYMRSDETEIKLADSNAFGIRLKEGKLYYIDSESVLLYSGEGTLHRIDLETQENITLIDGKIRRFNFFGDELICLEKTGTVAKDGKELAKTECFSYDMNGSNREKTDFFKLISNEEYCASIKYTADEQEIIVKNKDITKDIASIKEFSNTNNSLLSFKDEYLIYFFEGSVRLYNTNDKTTREYSLEKPDFAANHIGFIMDYTFLNDRLVYTDSTEFYIVGDDGNVVHYLPETYKNEDIVRVVALYSGKDCVYGEKEDGAIVRIVFERSDDKNIVKEEEL